MYFDVRGHHFFFFTGGSFIMDSYFVRKRQFKVKMSWWICFLQTCSFSLLKTNWWTGLVWIIVMLLSAVCTHSDGTHSLQKIHLWASDVMLHFSKSSGETSSSMPWMAWGWNILIFQWPIPIKKTENICLPIM